MPTDPAMPDGRHSGLALAAGAAVVLLQSAGALKSAPPLAALPLDLTVALAALAAPLLLALALTRAWRVAPAALPALAAFALLLTWAVASGAWSLAGEGGPAKLRELVLLGPPMVLAGLLVGAEPAARRGAVVAMVLAGPLVALAIARGLATGAVVLGGPVEGELARVQYQHAGIAIATAAGLAALGAVASRGALRLAALALVAALAALALLPGGRTGLAALALAAAAAPALALLRARRPGAALVPPALVVLAGAAGLAVLLAHPALADGLRTVERFIEGDLGTASLRAPLWGAALDLAGDAAPLGLGAGGFPVAAGFGDWRGRYPHNHALEALAELGLPGLLLWAGAWGGALLCVLRRWRALSPGRVGAIAALALPVLLTIMVSTDLGNRMAWFALGLLLSTGVEARPFTKAVAT